MELTGEAYWSFRTWIFDAQGIKPKFIDDLNEKLLQCYLIEWLDSVGIYLDIQLLPHFDEAEIVSVCWYANVATSYGCYNSDDNYPTRQRATEKAIERAVELFNGK